MQGFELLIKEFHGISIMKPRVIDERDENGQRLHWLLEGKQQASDRARQDARSRAAMLRPRRCMANVCRVIVFPGIELRKFRKERERVTVRRCD